MIEVFGVEHIDLTVNDLARSEVFYGKVLAELGFRRLGDDVDVRWENAHLSIAIRAAAAGEASAAFNRYRVGLHHLALKARRREDIDQFHDFLRKERLPILDSPALYPQYGPNYYALFFADPDGIKLELVHFPWGYWRKAQTEGLDERPRYSRKAGVSP